MPGGRPAGGRVDAIAQGTIAVAFDFGTIDAHRLKLVGQVPVQIPGFGSGRAGGEVDVRHAAGRTVGIGRAGVDFDRGARGGRAHVAGDIRKLDSDIEGSRLLDGEISREIAAIDRRRTVHVVAHLNPMINPRAQCAKRFV